MPDGSIRSVTNQVVEILRDGMHTGRWKETLSGRERLAEELNVSHQTIVEAMRRLTKNGMLVSQGPARRRRIILPEGNAVPHSRIALLYREEHLAPQFSAFANLYVESLKEAGITPSPYHMPVWGYKPEGLQRCLDSLYKLTPPTALITGETAIMIAMRDLLARRGILSPRDVSLISLDQSPFFTWPNPQVAHFYWDPRPLHRRVVRWAKDVALGKDDRHQINTSAKFFDGGTIGPTR